MPSHITHAVFAREAAAAAGFSIGNPPWFLLGSQGPDIFLHNRRRTPNAVLWGRALHYRGFGTFVRSMENRITSWDTPEGNYILGFATHGILDRVTHPYIHAFSSSRNSAGGLLHPFLERLIDVKISLLKDGRHPHSVSLYEKVSLGQAPPQKLVELLSAAASQRFQAEQLEQRITNAYLDTMGLLQLTERLTVQALEYIRNHHNPKRLLALFHPPDIPGDLDVLNLGHRKWLHPWDGGRVCSESFIDLYEQSLDQAAVMIAQAVNQGPNTSAGTELAGNGNLNGSEDHHRPFRAEGELLPLGEVLDTFTQTILGL